MAFVVDHLCFACGKDNPVGLKLSFTRDGDAFVTTFVADRLLQGYEGIVHGGILATLLDEVMVHSVWNTVGPAATAKLDVRYKRPAPTEQPLAIRGWITGARRNGRLFETAATVSLPDGTLLAEATGVMMRTEKDTSATS